MSQHTGPLERDDDERVAPHPEEVDEATRNDRDALEIPNPVAGIGAAAGSADTPEAIAIQRDIAGRGEI
jgi:hypothetical protein